MNTFITLTNILDANPKHIIYSKKDTLNKSGLNVGIVYIVVSSDNGLSLNSIVIKTTKLFKDYMKGFGGQYKYAVIEPDGSSYFLSELASGNKFIDAHKLTYLNKSIEPQLYELEGFCPIGMLGTKFPTKLDLSHIIPKRDKDDIKFIISLNRDRQAELRMVEVIGNYYNPISVIKVPLIKSANVDLTRLHNWDMFSGYPYLESIKSSNVSHFAEPGFLNLVYNIVPTRVIATGAVTPAAVLYYLISILGKTFMDKLYNNRDVSVGQINVILPNSLPALPIIN